MIPIRLEIENFRSFTAPVQIPLDFAPLFCIVGENGAGKSSIVEAILWALFDVSRGGARANLVVRTGAKYAKVTFDFEMWEQKFRVIRQRYANGQSRAKLLRAENEHYVPMLTSHRKSDVDAMIRQILGADYNSFRMATAFFQNESAIFSTMQPAERRKALSKMLGIERFQKIRDAAAQRAREANARKNDRLKEMSFFKEKLDGIQDPTEQINAIDKEIADYSKERSEVEKQLDEVTMQLGQIKEMKRRIAVVDKSIKSIEDELSEMERTAKLLQTEIEEFSHFISRSDEIEAQKKKYDELQALNQKMVKIAQEYSRLQKALRKTELELFRKTKEFEREKSALTGKIDSWRSELRKIEDEIADADTVMKKMEQLESARKMLSEMEEKKKIHDQLMQEKHETEHKIEAERQKLREQIEDLVNKNASMRNEILRIPEVEGKLNNLRSEIDKCSAAYERAKVLRKELSSTEADIAKLVEQCNNLSGELAERKEQKEFVLSGDVARCPRCGSELSGTHKNRLIKKLESEIANLRAKLEKNEDVLEQRRRDARQLSREIEQLEAEETKIKELRKEIDLNVGELARINQFKEQTKLNEERINEIEKILSQNLFAKPLQAKLSGLLKKIEQIEFIPEALNEAQKMVNELLETEKRWEVIADKRKTAARIKKQIDTAKTKLNELNERDVISKLTAQVEELRNQLNAMEYSEERHNEIGSKLASLGDVPREFFQLENASKKLPELKKRLASTRERRSQRRKELQALTAEKTQIEARLATAQEIKKSRDELANKCEDIDHHISLLRSQRSTLESDARAITEAKENIARISEEVNQLGSEEMLFGQVAEICGPLGIQDWLMQRYLVQMERDANETLELITNGELTVRLMPEEGEKLSVRISDRLGERPYQTYSGGEEFRIDFALRLALSKVLANRSGFPLRTLIIDEGFGSQDENGLAKLVETIYEIQSQFDRIIVITHLQSLRDKFPARIVVKKGAEGSQVFIE